MKKLIITAMFVCILLLSSCSTKSDSVDVLDIAEISGLVTEKGYTEEDFQDELLGKNRDSIINAWGEPDGMLYGFWGDIWLLSDESDKQIILYYDQDGIIENIRIAER